VAIGGFGCRAQTTPATPALTQKQIDRRIELIVRSHFNLPPDVVVHIGPRSASDTPGYHTIAITLTQGMTTSDPYIFQLSDDGKSFMRIEKFDLTQDAKDSIPIAGRPVRGPEDAPVTIVVFDDLECPFCSEIYSMLFPETMMHYGGKLRIVYKDFPLQSLHPWAMHAAVDANCLAAQSDAGYWDFLGYVHTHGADISGDKKPETAFTALDKKAADEGVQQKVNLEQLNACVAKQDTATIQTSIGQGHALKVEPTPTLFVNGEKIEGALPKEQLWSVIDRAMTAAGVTPPKQ
jgi:protein-disulfide isomerase